MTKTLYAQAKVMFDKLSAQQGFEKDKVNPTSFVVSNTSQNKAIPVVFMDLDETVLNNYAYQNWTIFSKTGYTPSSFSDWVVAAKATAIAGAIDFIKYVWANGGVVMFNSDRPQVLREETQKNLVDLGLNAKQLPDWAFWMQGIDPSKAKPWEVNNYDHTKKELRMDTMNAQTAGYDLSQGKVASGNKVVLKTIMRVGDNLDDFNDLASRGTLNAERKKVLEDHIGNNFGNTTVSGKIYEVKTQKWVDESWNEGYVLIGGNVAYGGWVAGLKKDYYKLSDAEQARVREEILLKSHVWNGQKDWNPQK